MLGSRCRVADGGSLLQHGRWAALKAEQRREKLGSKAQRAVWCSLEVKPCPFVSVMSLMPAAPHSPLLAGTPWLPRLFAAEKLLAGCPSSWSCPDGQGMRRMLVFLQGFRAAALKSP